MEKLALRIAKVLEDLNPYTFDECFESVEECKNVYLDLLNQKEFESIIEELKEFDGIENIIDELGMLKGEQTKA